MQTHFTDAQLKDPANAEANRILRSCVHCGMCTTNCPTFRLLGDELDSPRGRIYLIKDMLENDKPASALVATHLDRCLSCLSCVTTCPADVDYAHLIDIGRERVAKTFRRDLPDRLARAVLARLLPRPSLVRAVLLAAQPLRPFARWLPGRVGRLLRAVPVGVARPSGVEGAGAHPAKGLRRKRVALLTGCVQPVIAPAINEATVRLLTRHGCDVIVARGVGCCGALTHHMGETDRARAAVKRNVAAWTREIERGGLDAIVANASGCGTMLKDYGHLLRNDPGWADRAGRIASLARDVSELLADLDLRGGSASNGPVVAYHSACSLQHGQGVHDGPRALLERAGFTVHDVPDGHLCCGSAGTYSLLQGDLADRLLAGKIAAIESTGAALVAAGNIGCIQQIGGGTDLPVVHTVELLDWADGGPRPAALKA